MQSDRPSRWVLWLSSYKWWILATLLLAGLGWWLLVEVPMTFYRSALGASETHKEALAIQIRALTIGSQIFLGLAVIVGAYLTLRRVRAAEKQAEAAHEGQLTERFTRAIEQLGSKEPAICLGGIYALERIAKDSERDHPQVMEVLCAFVRDRTANKESRLAASDSQSESAMTPKPPPTDIAAALTVISRNPLSVDSWNFVQVDLVGAEIPRAHLPGANLSEANLSGANLCEANLHAANLWGTTLSYSDLRLARLGGAELSVANLTNARLMGADLEKADLFHARLFQSDLTGAALSGANLAAADLRMSDLTRADLSGVDFRRAKLAGVNFSDAQLSGARLFGVDLSQARHLSQEQIQSAKINGQTKLPGRPRKEPSKKST